MIPTVTISFFFYFPPQFLGSEDGFGEANEVVKGRMSS